MARFSKISDKLFIFNVESRHYSEVSYPRAESRDTYVPRERAFHSATIVGKKPVSKNLPCPIGWHDICVKKVEGLGFKTL